jgi:hypothetical protein
VLALPLDDEVHSRGLPGDPRREGGGGLTADHYPRGGAPLTQAFEQLAGDGPLLKEHEADADDLGIERHLVEDLVHGQADIEYIARRRGSPAICGNRSARSVDDRDLVPRGPSGGGDVGEADRRRGAVHGQGVRRYHHGRTDQAHP